MLQRIQTVYMVLSILAMGALYLWFPVIEDAAHALVIKKSEPLVLALIISPVLFTLLAIFNYKKRKQQFVLNRLSILLNFVLLGVFVVRSLKVSGETLVSMKGIGVLLPIISIVFLVLANKAIKRDEDLVKSVDRLR
ncbi:MAG: DUF4293 domain-containing protein [Flavobacteriaceae bacterium]